jgi:hypothetical protein
MKPRKSLRDFLRLAMPALVVACLVPAARAQDLGVQAGAGAGQPARAVRLSYVDGKVRLAQGNQVLADQAVVNTPLLEGMQLTTGDDGKAEIQFEDGSVARISPDSSLTLAALRGSGATGDAEMVLSSGLAYFELQGGDQVGKLSVQFGPDVVTTSGFTVLRVALDNAPGEVAVFSGNAHLEGNNGTLAIDLHGGEGVALSATDPNGYNLAESIEPNSWDAWNSDRDQVLTSEAATQTGAPANMGQSENPAWNDLDANGSWYNVPGQGYIWSPYEAANAGFDPYGVGNWMWTPGFGYIWASGYPWGYMPFQCGAWNFYNNFGWGWAPGMGGCMPWWGMGFYGGPNFGYVPSGYHVIARPILPRNPVRGRPLPMVAVNHNEPVVHGALPARNGNLPVVIAGTSVHALSPLPARTEYAHPTMIVGTARTGAGAQPANGETAGTRPSYTRPAGVTPTQGAQNSTAVDRGSNSATFGRTNSAPANHPSNSAPHPTASSSSGAAPHPSGGGSSGRGGFSGGGGGGAPHPSGGGGGGGGGGRH